MALKVKPVGLYLGSFGPRVSYDKGDQPSDEETRPGHILEGHVLAEDTTRHASTEAAC